MATVTTLAQVSGGLVVNVDLTTSTLDTAISGTASNITATSNSTLTTLSSLSLPYSQVTGAPSSLTFADSIVNISGTVTLVNDSAAPGDSMYYGTNASGVLGWYASSSSGANTSLSNLTSPAINTSLLPGTTASFNIGSSSFTWNNAYFTGTIYTEFMGTPNNLSGSAAAFQILGGEGSGAGNTGGDIYIQSGEGRTGAVTGNIQIGTFNNSNADSGNILIQTGVVSGSAVNSGNLTLATGSVSGGATQGLIQFQNGSQGTAGYVWTSTDTSGSGSWMAPSGGSAITSLTGDVSATGPGAASATVNSVGGASAANIASTVTEVSSATNADTPSTLVLRDSSGNFSSGTITASLTGHASDDLALSGGTMSGTINMGSNQINDVGAPSVSTDAANKGYVDAAISGLTWQGPAQAYADSNVPLTGGATLTIDSYTVQNGNLVLLGNQTTASQNGEYTVSGIGSAYVLTPNGLPTVVGDAWLITNGTVYANSAFTATAVVPAAAFIEFAGPTAYIFNAPLSVTGNTVSISEAGSSTDGYLSSTDWNTFNNKQAAGNYATSGSGDVSWSAPSGAGPVTTSITATTNSTITTLSSLSLPGSQVTGAIAGNSGGTEIDSLVLDTGVSIAANTSAALYMDSSGYLQLANAASALPERQFWALGLAAGPVSSGNSPMIVVNGPYSLQSSDPLYNALVIGEPVWLSDSTAGGITQTAPSTSGSANYKIGIAISANTILIDKQLTGVS